MAGHDTSFYPSFTSKGLDTGTGNRQVDLGALYDKQKRLASDFKIPKTYKEAEEIYGPNLVGAPENIKSIIMTDLQTTIPEGKEVIKLKGKDVLVDKDRPKDFARFVAGLKDVMSGFTTDYDKLGGQYVDDGTGKEVYNPLGTLKEFDKTDLSNIKLSQSQLANIEKQVVDEFGEVPSPTEGIKEYLEGMKLVRQQETDEQIRKARRIGLEAFGNYALTEPVRQMYLNKAAEDAQNRYIRGRFALEATPTKIQDIMTAKQAQQGIAALSEAERAKAVAEQQKAANEFGAPQVTLARNVRFANASFKA